MKRAIWIISVVLLPAFTSIQKATAQPETSVSFQVFYDNLSPYGRWIEDPSYGNVWVPSVGGDFRPYSSSGHWVMSEYGNMWVSNYSWGWAPFHYGRWTLDSYYGWVWIPDTDWGPAWVSWRSSNDYYGWAPMGPGISLNMSFNNYDPPNDWWVFIPPAYIHHPHWHEHYYGQRGNNIFIQHTTIINNTFVDNQHTYINGPRADEIKKVTHKEVIVYKVGNEKHPGKDFIKGNTVNLYRPSVQKSGKEVATLSKTTEHVIEKHEKIDNGSGMPRSAKKQQEWMNKTENRMENKKPGGKNSEKPIPSQPNKNEAKPHPRSDRNTTPTPTLQPEKQAAPPSNNNQHGNEDALPPKQQKRNNTHDDAKQMNRENK